MKVGDVVKMWVPEIDATGKFTGNSVERSFRISVLSVPETETNGATVQTISYDPVP